MKAVIVAHGDLGAGDILKNECKSSNVIICADGGAIFAAQNGIIPDYLIGDFDSIDISVLELYKNAAVKIIKYPCDKDFTDTEICVDKAIELGCNEICIVAGIGSRLDHSLGNLMLLHKILKKGLLGYIAAKDCYVYLCNRELILEGSIGQTISVIPFGGNVSGIYLEGFKYPLTDAKIEMGMSIGLSNVLVHNICKIKVAAGELLVIKNTNNDI